MKYGTPPKVTTVPKTCVSFKNKIHLHKLKKHESIAHIMHEESVEGNANMSEIL